MSRSLKIINIAGARTNRLKTTPIVREMQHHPEIDSILLRTGRYHDEAPFGIFSRPTDSHVAKRIAGVLPEFRPLTPRKSALPVT
ncbi:MAG: hypothetical protein WA639_03070 [Candidatus Acidiferrum sp.]